MSDNIFWDLGFALYDKVFLDELLKLNNDEIKSVFLKRIEDIKYNERILTHFTNIEDEEEFNALISFFKEDIHMLEPFDIFKYRFLLSFIEPLNDFFIFKPRFYLSKNNFFFLKSKNCFIANLYYNYVSTDVNLERIDLVYDVESFIVKNVQFIESVKRDFHILEQNHSSFTKFDKDNYEFFRLFVDYIDNDKYGVVFFKNL